MPGRIPRVLELYLMIRRPLRPSFSNNEMPMLLDALREARLWSLKYGSCQPFDSPGHVRCYALAKAIDELGTELTGDPEYFWLRAHSTPPNMTKG